MTIDPRATPEPAPSRWNLKHLAILIAVVAVSFAAVGVAPTVVGIAFFSPAFFMRRGQLLDVLYWVFTCYPAVALLSLYVTWITACIALGHPPRLDFDELKDNDSMVILYKLTGVFLVGTPFAFLVALIFMLARVLERSRIEMHWLARFSSLFITPVIWVIAYGLAVLDPFFALYWYMN